MCPFATRRITCRAAWNRCGRLGEVYVIDSQSTDATVEIARSFGAKVVQFHYQGGWPKKRQWAMDTLPLAYDWIFLVDADEALTPELTEEIRQAIQNPSIDGYYIALRMFFLGRRAAPQRRQFLQAFPVSPRQGPLRVPPERSGHLHGDMEVHEHVVVDGANRHS